MAQALEQRTVLPSGFCDEVLKKVQEMGVEGEVASRTHETHDVFKRENDEQLLLWLNRWSHLSYG